MQRLISAGPNLWPEYSHLLLDFWVGIVLGSDFLQITESFAGRKVWRVIVESLMELCRAVQSAPKTGGSKPDSPTR